MSETIAAISTAIGESGIAIVRMSGKQSFPIAKEIFYTASKKKIKKPVPRKMYYGFIYEDDEMLDEVLIAFFAAPKSYTREDMVEIYCHGGRIPVQRVLALLLKKGARLAERGEFTKRAFLNGRLDLTQAEAVIDMIHAQTEKSYEVSLKQLEGNLKKTIHDLKEELLEILAYVEYSINFMEDAEEELSYEPVLEKGEHIAQEIEKMIQSSNYGKIVRDGVHTVILGKPNVGKSSLLNALLRENRAIVTDIPGTTRDTIEESIQLGGVRLRLTDTAGIRDTQDLVESMGVEKSLELAKEADFILAIFDVSRPLDEEDRKILDLLKTKKAIVLFNKKDLGFAWNPEEFLKGTNVRSLNISVLEKEGLDELEQTMEELFLGGQLETENDLLITNIRHRDLLEQVYKLMNSWMSDLRAGFPVDAVEVDLRRCYRLLGEITGETVDEDVLDRIFSEFCIGK